LIGEAAAAKAAGSAALSRQLLSSAATANAAHPTYYTTAVEAVAEVALAHRLEGC